MTKTTGTLLASAVAGLFATACTRHSPASAAKHEGTAALVACAGINACKGQSDCSTAKNACKGANACKGQGWLQVASEQACKDKGGKLVAGM